MEPDRLRLDHALRQAQEDMRRTNANRAAVGRAISQLRKTMKRAQADEIADPPARAERESDLHEMLHDAARLDQELKGLRAHVRLLKLKLLLIKL